MSPWLEALLGMKGYRRHIREVEERPPHDNLYEAADRAWNLKTTVSGGVPPLTDERGLMVVANHPRGMLDMFIVGGSLETALGRPGRVMVNRLIGESFPSLNDHIVGVDNMGRRGPERSAFNRSALSNAVEFMRTGGVLYVFPAGQVASWRLHSPEGWFRLTDHRWHSTFVALAREAQVPIQTIHVSGRNRIRYRIARLFGLVFGRILNFREFVAGANSTTTIRIGQRVPRSVIENESDADVSRLCRSHVFSFERKGSL